MPELFGKFLSRKFWIAGVVAGFIYFLPAPEDALEVQVQFVKIVTLCLIGLVFLIVQGNVDTYSSAPEESPRADPVATRQSADVHKVGGV